MVETFVNSFDVAEMNLTLMSFSCDFVFEAHLYKILVGQSRDGINACKVRYIMLPNSSRGTLA